MTEIERELEIVVNSPSSPTKRSVAADPATVDGLPIASPDAHSLRSWRLDLPYQSLPLSLNDRAHRMVVWRAQSNLKNQVRTLTQAAKIPRLQRIVVELHWLPVVRRTRDNDNATMTLKSAIDGLRDYGPRYSVRKDALGHSRRVIVDAGWTGIIADDSPEHVTWLPPVIHPPEPNVPGKPMPKRLWLVVSEVTDA